MNTNHITTEELTNYTLNSTIEKLEGKGYVNSLVSGIEKRVDEAREEGYATGWEEAGGDDC